MQINMQDMPILIISISFQFTWTSQVSGMGYVSLKHSKLLQVS